MNKEQVVAVLDIGKTNKKFFLFDRDYRVVFQRSLAFPQTLDEDGYECENLTTIESFLLDTLYELLQSNQYDIQVVNFSTYGASLVHVDEAGKPVVDMFNYLKPYPEGLLELLLPDADAQLKFELETCCPIQGNLNSGLQLFRIYHKRKELYAKIFRSLHFPQYLSSLLSGQKYSDITSIGCHTSLWDFGKKQYHAWTKELDVQSKLAPIKPCDTITHVDFKGYALSVGIGLHDSSAALVPYLKIVKQPFLLVSTGTWSITLNPFNSQLLSKKELSQGCLCYLNYQGNPVKASRVFLGNVYGREVERIAAHFQLNTDYFHKLTFAKERMQGLSLLDAGYNVGTDILLEHFPFAATRLDIFPDAETAYYQLMYELVQEQRYFMQIVDMENKVREVFVDGGFGHNDIFMNMMAMLNPTKKLYAAEVPQSTALGAAMVLGFPNEDGDSRDFTDLIKVKFYPI
ncbi:MAG: FGGY family carbohydrate kinase [Chitinophagaceae bacterium]